jgi:hypothetical protein
MAAAFKLKAMPTRFVSSWFQSPDANKFDTTEIVVDIKRNNESIAVDVVRGTQGRNNVNKRFTTKTYTPPVYDEYANFNESERLNRALGQTEYDDHSMAVVIAAITDDQAEMQAKIIRAIEKQAVDSLFAGQIALINGDTVDFKQKATHKIAPVVDWSNANGVPLDDMAGAAKLNRQDGYKQTTDGLFGEDALKLLFNNDQFKEKANQQFEQAQNMAIRPPMMNSEGAVFHGQLTIGDYRINIWSYPQFYDVPLGYSLPNEGTKVPYIPTDKVFIGNASGSRFDLYYAGIEKLAVAPDPRLASLGLSMIPMTMKGDFHEYGAIDQLAQNAIYGVKSAPLCVPTEIDSFCILTVK